MNILIIILSCASIALFAAFAGIVHLAKENKRLYATVSKYDRFFAALNKLRDNVSGKQFEYAIEVQIDGNWVERIYCGTRSYANYRLGEEAKLSGNPSGMRIVKRAVSWEPVK